MKVDKGTAVHANQFGLPEPYTTVTPMHEMPVTLFTAAQLLAFRDAAVVLATEQIEAAARYGWQHASWDWEAVKGGLDRFTIAPKSLT